MPLLRLITRAVLLGSTLATTLHAQAAGGIDPRATQTLRFRNIGPFRGGRVTTVAGVPQRKLEFYMGATGGGVWKTIDAGQNWLNVSDGFFSTGSIGSIRVAPSNPDVVWAGTGSDGIRSNVIVGRGIYRSTDAGKTWTFLGLRDVGQIAAIVVNPTNPDIALVAAQGLPFGNSKERGVYRTTNGGQSWEKVLFVNDSTGITDLSAKPDDPSTLYAAAWRGVRRPWAIISGSKDDGGIYRSTDGGSSWTKLAGGLPTGIIGKSNIAVSPAAPRRVYVLIEAEKPKAGVYRSDDAGESWTQVSTMNALLLRPFYYTNIDADPTNADNVWVQNETMWKSTDGARNFVAVSTPHGDNHDIWINPTDPDIMIQSNDGGANVSIDGGRTWSTQYNQSTSELYQVFLDNHYPYRVYGAQQDNTTVIVQSLPVFSVRPDQPAQYWMTGPGCETGPIVPSPWNADVVYGACKGQFSRLHMVTGQEQNSWVGAQSLYGNDPKDLIYRFQRVSPMDVSPNVKGTVYFGSQFLHRSRDDGVTWERMSPDLTANTPETQGVSGGPITRDVTGEEFYSTLYAIRESSIEPGVIWTGSNDGPVFVTRNNGVSWTKVTPPDLPPGGRVQNIDVSRHRKGTAYIAVYRYLLGDFKPYAYRTTDYGRTWTRLTTGTNGVPDDTPTRVVREDPEHQGLLYLGTEFGFYVSNNDGASWAPMQLNLPVVPITDIKLQRRDLVLSTMGRGFWILDDLTPLVQYTDASTGKRAVLHAPRVATRWRHQASPAAPGNPEYPGAAATIDFWLGAKHAAPPVLEIRSALGTLVRTFTTAGAAARTTTDQAMRAPRRGAVSATAITDNVGENRFSWDLLHATTPGGRGPMVAPGRYSVRLIVGSDTLTQPLVVQADPRVKADGITDIVLAAQERHELDVRAAIEEARRTLTRARETRTQMQSRGAPMAREAEDIVRALETADGRYQAPKLVAQLEYLYGMTVGADQRVPRDASARLATLKRELAEIVKHLDALTRMTTADAIP
ncbi:MAG: hypothetical protein H7099_09975 [Gemmatimonadaceae bacterium]|nr:hypothetical protein [Gemmatimonadaceae bacterium]